MSSHSIPSRTRFGAINNAVYCNEKDYKRLYGEIIEYLLYDLDLCDSEENRYKYEQDFDALGDLICKKEEFDFFFEGRKSLWKLVGLY